MRTILCSLGLLACVSACMTDKVTGERHFSLVQWSVAEEQEMGDTYAPNFESQFDSIYPHPSTNQYLGGLVKEMASHSVRRSDFDYNFKVLNSSVPNAFALPGGYVYITRGLLENLETEAQFVSIMGHELGHVEHQHAMRGANRQILTGIGIAIIGTAESIAYDDPDRPLILTGAAGMVAPLALLSYGREDELESDRRGVYFAAEMGHDPLEGKKTFEYFQRLEQEAGGASTFAWFRTHPLNEDRIHQIDRYAREEFPQALDRPSYRGEDGRFAALVAELRKEAPAYRKLDEAMAILAQAEPAAGELEQAERSLAGALQTLPEEPLLHIALGEVRYAQETRDGGRRDFEQALALYERLAPGESHWKPHLYLGSLDVDAGNGAPARARLKEATRLYPWHPLGHYLLGQALELDQEPRTAIRSYKNVKLYTEEGSSLWRKADDRIRALGGR